MTHEEEYIQSLQEQFGKITKQSDDYSPQQVTMSNSGKKRESDFQNYHIAILKMSNFQFEELHGLSIIIRIGGGKKEIEAIPKEIQALRLLDKDFK